MTKITVVPSTEKTSQDIPLTFALDNAQLDSTHLHLYGTIINTSTIHFFDVDMIITIRAEDGTFICRDDLPVRPSSIAPGEIGYFGVGYIIRCTDCSKREAITVEYKIVGSKRSKRF